MAQSIYGMIYDELDAMNRHNAPEFEQYAIAFDMLDREAIAGLILEGSTWWIEWPNHYGDSIDDDEGRGIEQLKNYIGRKGWRYLYDL